MYAPTHPRTARTASDCHPQMPKQSKRVVTHGLRLETLLQSPDVPFRDQSRDRGRRGGVKLNKEDYFLFPDFIQEQCNPWFFAFQGELGWRAEGAEDGGHDLRRNRS